jgi:hypothetical protein
VQVVDRARQLPPRPRDARESGQDATARCRGNFFAGDDHALGVNLIDTVAKPHLDAEPLESLLRSFGQIVSVGPEHFLGPVDEDDARRRRI